jgi:hypothetical protein
MTTEKFCGRGAQRVERAAKSTPLRVVYHVWPLSVRPHEVELGDPHLHVRARH